MKITTLLSNTQKAELDKIIRDYKLKEDYIYSFVRTAVRGYKNNGKVLKNHMDLTKAIPLMSRMTGEHQRYKRLVLDEIMEFLISSNLIKDDEQKASKYFYNDDGVLAQATEEGRLTRKINYFELLIIKPKITFEGDCRAEREFVKEMLLTGVKEYYTPLILKNDKYSSKNIKNLNDTLNYIHEKTKNI